MAIVIFFEKKVVIFTENHGRLRSKSRPRSGRFETTAVEVGAVDFWRPTANTKVQKTEAPF